MVCVDNKAITIRICYLDTNEIWDRTIQSQEPVSIHEALSRSEFLVDHPSFDVASAKFGVFGQVQSTDYLLQDLDRVEIYRPLTFDPKTSRRRRAIHRQKARNIKKKVPINDSTI